MVIVSFRLRNWRFEQDHSERFLHLPVHPAMAGAEIVEIRKGSDWVTRRYRDDIDYEIHATYRDLARQQAQLPF
jgi:hypothetical protein